MAKQRKAEDPAKVRARQAKRMQKLRDGGFRCPARAKLFSAGRDALAAKVENFAKEAAELRDLIAAQVEAVSAGRKPIKARLKEACNKGRDLSRALNEILGKVDRWRDDAANDPWRPLRDALHHVEGDLIIVRDHGGDADARTLRELMRRLLAVDWDIEPTTMERHQRLAAVIDAPPRETHRLAPPPRRDPAPVSATTAHEFTLPDFLKD